MRRAIPIGILIVAATALAREPPPVRTEDRWIHAINDAEKELAACRKLGGSLYGDVVVTYRRKKNAWQTSASWSLGGIGAQAASCMEDAIKRHFAPDSYDQSVEDKMTTVQTIGTPVIVLPPIDKLLPVWRRARVDATARRELVKLLPPDYQVTKDGCFRTDRESIRNAEYLWLPTAGAWVPRQWDTQLTAALGDAIVLAMWRPDELITRGTRGTCLVSFDAAQQTALRSEMDKAGARWVGGFEDVLLHPRTALPTDVAFTQVATQTGRVCALSTAGEVTCCGRPGASPPKGPFAQITVGGSFECALDKKGNPTCWGTIDAPPAGPFTKLSAESSHVCGVRPNGTLACWGTATNDVAKPPAGTFVDVAAGSFSSCGVHKNGSAECWGDDTREKHPPGAFTRVAADGTHACGVRKDGSLGCWSQDHAGVDTPLAGAFTDVAVGDAFHLCARRRDGALECTGARQDVAQPPSGTFTQLAGDHDTFCAVGTDHHVSCWGEAWPGAWSADNTWPYARVLGLTAPRPAFDAPIPLAGRIIDEHGMPLANVDVLACAGYGPCVSLASTLMTSSSSLAQLAAGAQLDPTADALTTTGADGRWTATVQRKKTAHYGDPVKLLITAPGRDVVERGADDPTQLAGDVVLRPASSVDIDLRCGTAPCTGDIRVALSQSTSYGGTHLEHLAPGSYELEAITDFGQPGERRGIANVTVTFVAGAQHVRVAATPVGTSASIKGTVSIEGRPHDGISVRSRCEGGPGVPVRRETKSDANGAFELRAVGRAPCTVTASSKGSLADVKVPRVPANGVSVVVRESDDR